jgi:hypothetical protein
MHVLRMRRLIAQRPIFGDAIVQTEAAQLLDRVRSSDCGIAGIAKDAHILVQKGAASVQARMCWVRDYIPRIIPPGHRITANVRFRNTSAVPLRHAPPANMSLAPRWLDSGGQLVDEAEDLRTPLPLDMQPGQELTLPVRIAAPPGRGNIVCA